jgi:hypothetical protein
MMTFREKSAAASLTLVALTFAAFGAWAVQQSHTTGEMLIGLVAAIVVQIVLQIIAHIVFAVQGRREAADERDREVGQRAQRNAYWVLMTAVWVPLGLAVAGIGGQTMIAALMGAIVLAELVRFASQLVYYRTAL